MLAGTANIFPSFFYSCRMASRNRPKIRNKWTDKDIISAITAVNCGEMTISVAAMKLTVPYKTLDTG